MRTLFHGSERIVKAPQLVMCKPHNDYGPGFYCTEDAELAKEWACRRQHCSGFCNEYLLHDEGLAELNLDEHPLGAIAWISVFMEHRIFDTEWNSHIKRAFLEKYHVDLSGYDIVTGYRADDSYFSIARAFVAGTLTDTEVAEALHFGDLGRQVVLKTQRAFDMLEYVKSSHAPSELWHQRWMQRDASARTAYRNMRSALQSEQPPAVPRQGKRIFELVEERG